MSRVFTAGSIAIHGLVIGVVTVAQLAEVGPLPTPRRILAFAGAPLITHIDIALPAPAPRSSAPSSATIVSPNAAPLVAPPGILPETGRESSVTSRPGDPDAAIGIGRGSGTIDGLGTSERIPPPPPLPPPQPVRLRAGIETPRKVVDVAPPYPAVARMAHIEGVVILEAVIDAHGGVESVRVLRSIPLLDQAAVDAVRQWRFTPARLNGEAIPVVMTVTVNFTLQGR